MKHFGILAAAFIVTVILLSSAHCDAQAATDSSNSGQQTKPVPSELSGTSYKSRPIPQVEVLPPFLINPSASAKTNPLEYRSKDQITETDRSLTETAGPKIREEASLAGIEFDQGKWSYQQLVCKALPDHVFLLFRQDNGPGDVSRFSAAIPRGSGGSVRVIPIERRGYSLFSPASINAITVAKFNRIRADEPQNKSADWLATALCYATLAGARPEISPAPKKSENATPGLSFPPTLEIGSDGGATVRFVDVASARQPTQWALTFNPQGQLLKVVHFPAPVYTVQQIPQTQR